MGETKKIVVEHFPADKLPEELRRGLESGDLVRVTVESETESVTPPYRSLSDFVGAGRGLYSTPEEATDFIRNLRDEWDD